MPRTVLFLDTPDRDLKGLAKTFGAVLPEGTEIEVIEGRDALIERLDAGLPYSLLVLDSVLGSGSRDGIDILKAVREIDPTVPVIAVAETGSVDSANRAIQAGASDFLVRSGRLKQRARTALAKVRGLLDLMDENRVLEEQNMLLREASRARNQIIGRSAQIGAVIECVERVAVIPRPILIVGERGTGKELVARAVHEAAGGPGRAFVAVNCAAFPDALLENELFGHERGAFTGAEAAVRGRFEQADGGTLFLDEIGNMSRPFQQKILRVVEYGRFTRVGGSEEIATTARIIAATNRDLRAQMEAGEFLRDLYDRLTFEVIEVPPLRQREGDIELLAHHFLDAFMKEIPALGGKRLAASAVEALGRYSFPGNIRELKNIIERAAYRDTTNEITPEDIGLLERDIAELPGGTFKEKVEALERRLVLDTLEAAGGNKAEAARRLGLSYHQFRYYHGKYEGT